MTLFTQPHANKQVSNKNAHSLCFKTPAFHVHQIFAIRITKLNAREFLQFAHKNNFICIAYQCLENKSNENAVNLLCKNFMKLRCSENIKCFTLYKIERNWEPTKILGQGLVPIETPLSAWDYHYDAVAIASVSNCYYSLQILTTTLHRSLYNTYLVTLIFCYWWSQLILNTTSNNAMQFGWQMISIKLIQLICFFCLSDLIQFMAALSENIWRPNFECICIPITKTSG